MNGLYHLIRTQKPSLYPLANKLLLSFGTSVINNDEMYARIDVTAVFFVVSLGDEGSMDNRL